jgi:four helix bundle protein
MKSSEMRDRAKAFSLHVIAVCDEIETKKNRGPLVNQIVRSSTSIGANIHEAAYGCSRADFINKLHIALKECYETEYWIEMLQGAGSITDATAAQLMQECNVIRAMLVKSVVTAKKNKE